MNDQPNPPFAFSIAVEAFNEAWERARLGKIAAFALFTVSPDGNIGWKWHLGNRPTTDLIGGLACMQQAIITKAMAEPVMPEPVNQTPQ